jgi:Rrf2 family protein
MKLSKETEYCLIALKYLAKQAPDDILQTGQVAEATGLPKPFLARIFVKLVRQNVLKSFRGKRRGYQLNRAPEDITVKDILEAVEGADVFQRCVFWSERCSDDNPCILHEYWQKKVKPEMTDLMETLTLKELSQK